MILLSRFYRLWNEQDIEPSQALSTAQRWLRDAKPEEILDHCKRFIPELATPSGRLSSLYRQLQLDYSHPFYWAAFSYTGA